MASALFELKGKSVYVAGHRGMVGSAIARRLAREDVQLVTVDRREVDLSATRPPCSIGSRKRGRK
ncbi:nucleoside-diphosphate-sugar epimerase [Bradyrhizobium sp. LB1.3]